jgi:peptidoglycan endopeptidase LytF
MNRKNTILIAVLINVGLLAILLIAALTTQEDLRPTNPVMAEAPLSLPKFDERPVFTETSLAHLEQKLDTPSLDTILTSANEPLVHTLPPLVSEAPLAIAAPQAKAQAPLSSFATPSPILEVAVKKGDNLAKIAKQHQTSVDEIIKLNHLPSSFLKVGQILKIPTERSLQKVAEKKVVEQGPEYYTMKVGENPWAIAMKHHMKVDELLRLNGLNEEKARKLKPGDRLRIR